jgi:hypothetical protein
MGIGDGALFAIRFSIADVVFSDYILQVAIAFLFSPFII